jgi:hypothetical protein
MLFLLHLADIPVLVSGVSREQQDEKLLAKLPYAASATFNHYRWQGESQCLPGTRSYILGEIMAWARADAGMSSTGSGQHRIFWLDGMAGTGKSTIARTVARICSDEGRLSASFFFSRGGGELETARMFVTTIAVQLARRNQQLQAGVCEALRAHPDIAEQMLADQRRHLVLGPCERLAGAARPPLGPLVIIVDAPDECKAPAEIEFVLALLSETSGLVEATPLRISLTSRPEITVRAGLHDMPEGQRHHVILHHVESALIDHDSGIFFERTLSSLTHNRTMLHGFSDEEVLQRLVRRADGLFIWAATACRFIKEGGPLARSRPDMIMTHRISDAPTSPERKLDAIYTAVLRNALREQFTANEREAA